MMASPYLEYEVALLLAKYGKNAVLSELAKKMQLSHEELKSLLKEIPNEKAPGRSRRVRTAVESIESIIQQYPAKANALRTLYARFQNRTFLPELRDVRRFFERHSRDFGRAKSRAESCPDLFKVLAELDQSDLDELCVAETENGYSSLGVISAEILREHK